jgi:hypothetical protein
MWFAVQPLGVPVVFVAAKTYKSFVAVSMLITGAEVSVAPATSVVSVPKEFVL